MKKWIAVMLAAVMLSAALAGCGNRASGNGDVASENLEGNCEEILGKVYENTKLDDAQFGKYETMVIDESNKEYILGTADVDFTEAISSAPMINAIAYQCVLLRVEEGADVEAVKKALVDNADPRKWICVEAESVVVENVGDVVLFLMADKETADAVKASFLALGEV